MHKRIFSLAFACFFTFTILNWGCTKLDTTNLGTDLLPVVDNVNTFADTFRIFATQKDYQDTTLVSRTDIHALGNIWLDPLFGRTEAHIYLQLKPTIFPFSFGPKDSLTGPNAGFDSVVLCLSYRISYGDTNQLQQLQVNEIDDNLFRDSTYNTNYKPSTGNLIGSKTVDITKLDEYVIYANKRDSAKSQIRIKLDNSYLNKLINADSISFSGMGNHFFFNDSIYRREFKGFAVSPVTGTGNALMYLNLADTNTKLEVHYRMRKAGGVIDTTYSSFRLRTISIRDSIIGNTKPSATANYVKRDRLGSPSNTPTTDELYLQTQPGTYASLSIPDLAGWSNRIIHRAELIVEQIPDNPITDSIFSVPNFLYLDLKDTGTVILPALPKYKPVYYDLNPTIFYDPDNKTANFYPYQSGVPAPEFSYFGGYARRKYGPTGSNIYYNFNISRYIQHLVKDQGTNYEMRLFPAYDIHYSQYSTYVPYSNSLAFGRVKIGSGTNPNYKMRLRVIYSLIK